MYDLERTSHCTRAAEQMTTKPLDVTFLSGLARGGGGGVGLAKTVYLWHSSNQLELVQSSISTEQSLNKEDMPSFPFDLTWFVYKYSESDVYKLKLQSYIHRYTNINNPLNDIS